LSSSSLAASNYPHVPFSGISESLHCCFEKSNSKFKLQSFHTNFRLYIHLFGSQLGGESFLGKWDFLTSFKLSSEAIVIFALQNDIFSFLILIFEDIPSLGFSQPAICVRSSWEKKSVFSPAHCFYYRCSRKGNILVLTFPPFFSNKL